MNTETLDKLYLEWSQFTRAKTASELRLINALHNICLIEAQNQKGGLKLAARIAKQELDALASNKHRSLP